MKIETGFVGGAASTESFHGTAGGLSRTARIFLAARRTKNPRKGCEGI
jgi:hypothetical protein